jgi:carbon-monoxide dehydrogenase catalytic subunit
MPNDKSNDKRTVDPAALEILKRNLETSTLFSRALEIKPCPIGAEGACCRVCAMGPCRLTGKDKEEKTGVCGATMSTIAARNFARMVAAGTAAHSDHGRDVALTLLAVAEGKSQDYQLRDIAKLERVASYFNIKVEGRAANEIAAELATKALEEFGKQEQELTFVSRAPKKRQELWRKLAIAPRGVDREVVETLHRTTVGTDQAAEHILDQALRCALADGWGGSMIATDLQDILFGTPVPVRSKANLGVLKEDEVNILIHGHEPILAEMIVEAVQKPSLLDYAAKKGAKGINLAGICCTANEVLVREGIPTAGNMLHQELAILTGAVDAMVVDVQCVLQGLARIAEENHTLLITTSKKAKMPGTIHIEFSKEKALATAEEIIKAAIDNFENRRNVFIPKYSSPLVAGFSHEYIRYMLGGRYRASFRPLNDNVINGRIRGVAAIVGCNNPRVVQDEGIIYLVREFIKNNVLVVATGCGAIASGKHGFLTPETMSYAGPGLREVCEAVGMPPVLHLGACVDNSRILTILTEVVEEGGLGEDIDQVPAVAICPEWMSEKALAIATYAVATGCYVIFGGVGSPVAASTEVTNIITEGWEAKVGGKLEFEADYQKILEKALQHIEKKRDALGINIERERVLYDMEMRRELSV